MSLVIRGRTYDVDVTIVRGSSAPYLTVTLTNSAGTAIDLSGATLRFVADGDIPTATPAIDKAMVVASPASGIAVAEWTITDTDVTPGGYLGNIEATYSGTDVRIFGPIVLEIVESVRA